MRSVVDRLMRDRHITQEDLSLIGASSNGAIWFRDCFPPGTLRLEVIGPSVFRPNQLVRRRLTLTELGHALDAPASLVKEAAAVGNQDQPHPFEFSTPLRVVYSFGRAILANRGVVVSSCI